MTDKTKQTVEPRHQPQTSGLPRYADTFAMISDSLMSRHLWVMAEDYDILRQAAIAEIVSLRTQVPTQGEASTHRRHSKEIAFIDPWGPPTFIFIPAAPEPAEPSQASGAARTQVPTQKLTVPEDLQTRYKLAKAQLALLPPSAADEEDDEWAGTREWCEEVIALIERIARLQGRE